MIRVLRAIGLMNLGVWLGLAVFFTFAVGPVFFTPRVLALFGGEQAPYARAYAGTIAQIVLERYYLWHIGCGFIAWVQLFAERFYWGQAIPRLKLGVLIAICLLNLTGGLWLQPRLKALQAIRYQTTATPEQRAQAGATFKAVHAVSQVLNLLATGGIVCYFFMVVMPPSEARFLSSAKLRS